MKTGVAVFVLNDSQILLTHRVSGSQAGFWEVPAGHVKEGESPKDTAVREVKEETNLDIKITSELGIYTNEALDFICHMFRGEVIGGDIKNLEPQNHSSVSWFKQNMLPDNLGVTTRYGLRLLNS